MKTLCKILVLAAALVGISAPAFADGFQVIDGPRMKFVGPAGALKDTTSIVGMTTSTATTTATDTTAWYDLAPYEFPDPGFSTQEFVKLAITTTVAADSVGYVIHWRSDKDETKFHATSQAYAVGSLSNVVSLLTADVGASKGRFFRVLLWGNDTGGVVHTYTITPLILGRRK